MSVCIGIRVHSSTESFDILSRSLTQLLFYNNVIQVMIKKISVIIRDFVF